MACVYPPPHMTCMHPPPSCLAQQPDDWAVAEGLLLKLSDFLEPWGGYKLEPVFNREPRR